MIAVQSVAYIITPLGVYKKYIYKSIFINLNNLNTVKSAKICGFYYLYISVSVVRGALKCFFLYLLNLCIKLFSVWLMVEIVLFPRFRICLVFSAY